jgi:hypothetical protein
LPAGGLTPKAVLAYKELRSSGPGKNTWRRDALARREVSAKKNAATKGCGVFV